MLKKKEKDAQIDVPEGAVNCTQAVRKTCKYGLYGAHEWTCDYIERTGRMRGCPYQACTKYIKDPDKVKSAKKKYNKVMRTVFN